MAGVLFQGLSGIGGGIALVMDPAGGTLQISVRRLQGSPFNDYLIPGLILLLLLGMFPVIVVYGLWARLIWSGPAALLVGVALIIWIGVEVLIVGYHSDPPLQLIYGLLGTAILVLALLPSVRQVP
jgi:hypothetical protein